jgi:hypothetical protein
VIEYQPPALGELNRDPALSLYKVEVPQIAHLSDIKLPLILNCWHHGGATLGSHLLTFIRPPFINRGDVKRLEGRGVMGWLT